MAGVSSSWNRVSGDVPLSELNKLRFRINAWIERRSLPFETFPATVEPYVPTLNVAELTAKFGEAILVASPTRALCFDFISQKLPEFFGPSSNIIDLGCGTGAYANHLHHAVDYDFYQGYDIVEHDSWATYRSDKVKFEAANLGVDKIPVGNANCIFSQSVLEHVQYDCSLFDFLTADEPKDITHVHFVPAIKSFVEHRYHGFRRYGPKSLSKLLGRSDVSDIQLFSMGNSITREMYWHQKGKTKRFQSRNGQVNYNYDRTISCAQNLANNLSSIITSDPKEASFYAIVFKQRVSRK